MSLPTRKQYLTYLASQLGVAEKPDGSNKQPYGVAYGMNGVPWCQEFDWFCAQHEGVPHLKTASTMAAVAQARKNGTWHAGTKGIQPGDSVYYHWTTSTRPKNQPDHVETCERVLADGLQTIGGNVGNKVSRQIRRANFLGYIAHEFAPEPKPKPEPKPSPEAKPSPHTKKVEASGLNLRLGPGTRFGVIKVLRHDEVVHVLGAKGNWTNVDHQEKDKNGHVSHWRGWVASRYLH